MKRGALLVLALALLGWGAGVVAGELQGRVVDVHDGDTLTLLDNDRQQHKIRLAGIDAPELGQAFGRAAREHLAQRVAGVAVRVSTTKTDRYGRIVGKVVVDDIDANLDQVRAGFAWHYKQYAREQTVADRSLYAAAENSARAARRGLWQEKGAVPPWEWRRR